MSTAIESASPTQPAPPSQSPVAAGTSEHNKPADVDALKLWASVGMMLDQTLGCKGADGVRVTMAKVKIMADTGEVMWIFSGVMKKQPVVAFHRGKLAADALFRFTHRRQLGGVKWRLDERPTNGVSTDDPSMPSLPPMPSL